MVFVEYAVRAVGLFYALGAVFLIRKMAMSDVLDRALSAITLEREVSKAILRRWLLGAVAALTGASGVAALLLSSWSLPLFVANLIIQGTWLVWSATAFPPEDAEEVLGRRRTFNAAFFYATITATVLALGFEDRLRPWGEWQTAVPVAAALVAYSVYLVRSLRWLPSRMAEDDEPDPVDDENLEQTTRSARDKDGD